MMVVQRPALKLAALMSFVDRGTCFFAAGASLCLVRGTGDSGRIGRFEVA